MRLVALAVVAGCLLWSRPLQAFVLSEDELEDRSTELGLMLRSFSFVLAGPVLRPPYNPLGDADPNGLGLFDLRATFSHKSPWLKLVLHNQLTARVSSHASVGVLALGRGQEPRRWLPLEADLAGPDGGFGLRESVDWAFAELTLGPLTLAAGRQPITFGRGKLWKPMDLISTFSLTEVDTEYKPGVDALRLDWTVQPQTNLILVAAAGRFNDDLLTGSTLALRAKQGLPRGEVGFLGGFVRRDVVLGADAVVDAGKFDLYTELVLHVLTDDSLSPRQPDTARTVLRALLGATFKPTSKLTLSPELYFNGFGDWQADDYLRVALSDRMAMGEMYNMGRAYLGGLALWEAHPLLNLSAGLIFNPVDPSGLLSMGLNYSLAANIVLVAGGYIPAGRLPDLRAPVLPEPRSEFGLYPYFVYVELKAAM